MKNFTWTRPIIIKWENQTVNYHYKIGFVCEISKDMYPVYKIVVYSQEKSLQWISIQTSYANKKYVPTEVP